MTQSNENQPITSIVRQWQMLRLLAGTPDGVSLKSLMDELSVGEKTVERYLKVLRQAGFTFTERREKDNTKRWLLATELVNNTPRLFHDEAMALLLCQHFSVFLRGTFLEEAGQCGMEKIYRHYLDADDQALLDRVRNMLPSNQCERSEGVEKPKKILETLIAGYEQRREIELCYQSATSTTTKTYIIHPYYFYPVMDSIYIRGHSAKRGEICSWKLDRVHDATLTDTRFTIPDDFDMQTDRNTAFAAFHAPTSPPALIRIHFSTSPAVQYVRERFTSQPQTIHPQPDGTFILEFTFPITPELKRSILTFGKNAEVLEPLELREMVATEIQQMSNVYA